MKNSERVKVGDRIRVNAESRRYKETYRCARDCDRKDCFMHSCNIGMVATIIDIIRYEGGPKTPRIITKPANLCNHSHLALRQLDEVFELLPSYNWKKL